MKKYLFLVSLLLPGMFCFTGCDDNKDEFLDEFKTILYLLNSGEQDIILYRTGENTIISPTINKGGSDLSTSASAIVSLLDEAELEAYNTQNLTSFRMLPANYYSIEGETSFNISGGNNSYQTFDIVFNTNMIQELEELENYVLPLELASVDSVNSDKSMVLYKPQIVIPTPYFERTGYTRNIFEDGGATEMNFELPVSLLPANRWSFTCNIEVDESMVDEYNAANDLNFSLLPADSYTLTNNGVVTFTEQDESVNLGISVSNTSLRYGNYILPLRLADCSKEEFEVHATRNTCLYGISYVPQLSVLQPIPLTVDMLSSNAVEPSEGSLANMLDNNSSTYFHSAYSVAVDGDHYLQVSLDNPITAFTFNYTGRSSGSAGNPARITLMGSLDGVEYSNIDQITEGLPTSAAGVYNSPVFLSPEFKHLRIVVRANQNGGAYFVLSEFSMSAI